MKKHCRSLLRRCVEKKTGARGLRSILEKVLLDTMYELTFIRKCSKVIIDEATVKGESEPIIMYENQEQAIAAAE